MAYITKLFQRFGNLRIFTQHLNRYKRPGFQLPGKYFLSQTDLIFYECLKVCLFKLLLIKLHALATNDFIIAIDFKDTVTLPLWKWGSRDILGGTAEDTLSMSRKDGVVDKKG